MSQAKLLCYAGQNQIGKGNPLADGILDQAFFLTKFQKLKLKKTQEIQNSRSIFLKNSMFLPQNSMFRNFYLVKSCKIFLKTQKFSRKLKILTSKLKLSELSSTLGFQSGVKKKPDLDSPLQHLALEG